MTAQLTTLPRISISPDLMAALDSDAEIGPLVAGDEVDGHALTHLAGPALGWHSDADYPATIASPDGEMAILVGRDGRLRTLGITENDALALLEQVQQAYIAA